ncbi:protein ACCELERATED CELL DEATH 6-like [Rhododendron vialii]|uniref:protein ACCELERATED CELL DEATH 6-like n=1 Tax=Rhododendron vialii TaxID=182163 RepID=UPI00265D8E9A|nr:protein ACCELERATED CELL DEATH 6-like [Rhododendron vialii]
MNPSLYTSAMEGKVAVLGQHKDELDGELTPNHNTVLHVATQFGHLNYVKEVLEACPSLLHRRNIKGETPLHMAAREGHAEIVKAMIARAKRLEEELESGLVGAVKEMLRATNIDGDTALHMAARYCHLEGEKYLKVFKMLTKRQRGMGKESVKMMIMRATKLHREEVEEIMRDREADEIMRAKKVYRDPAWHMAERNRLEKENRDTYLEVDEIMRAKKVDRDTAWHMAARNRLEKENRDTYLEVVKLLSQEDAEFQHPPNNFQETPLYLAAERGIMGVAIVDTLVETYKSLLTYSGPGGRTALHAAALKDFTGQSTKKLLEWKKDLINQADEYGWIPLCYATCHGNKEGVKELLAMDGSRAYITTTNKGDQDTATSNGNENGVRELLVMDESGAYITTTNNDDQDKALHIAAAYGHEHVIEELLHIAPDCWEMVNSKGQNALHIAVDMNRYSVIKFIFDQSWVGQLINQKDNEGNTPLHLLIASDCYADELWTLDRADHHAFNGKNMTPVDLVWSNLMEERMSGFAGRYIVDDAFLDYSGIKASGGRNLACNAHVNLAKLEKARRHEKEKRTEAKSKEQQKRAEAEWKERDEALERSVKLFQTFVIVAALIATITFAAAFTIPGGYDGNKGRDQGMVILARESAFKAFVITNTIAMVCSVTSIFLCLAAMLYSLAAAKADRYNKRYFGAVGLIIVSMFFLMIAFITSTFAVLAHAIALAVSTCIIACFAFIGYTVELGKLIAGP